MYRVLIAEDETRIAAFMEKGLRQAGYSPTIAYDGEVALDAALTQPFDIVLLDLGLPKQTGQVVLQRLREEGVDYPVIIVSARSPDGRDTRTVQQLANAWVSKPFRMKDLLQQMRLLLPSNE